MRRPAIAAVILLAACADDPVRSPSVLPTEPAAAQAAGAPQLDFCLTLLHNNDGESDLIDLGLGREEFGGIARFATVVNNLRNASQRDIGQGARELNCGLPGLLNRGAVVVSSGDNFLAGAEFQASLSSGTYYDAIGLDRIGYDALAIGNHEFDFGPSVLAGFITQFNPIRPPFLSANLDVSAEPSLARLATFRRIARSTVVFARTTPIGIIGATTPLLPFISSPGQVRVNPDVAGAVNAEATRLKRLGVNKIILISHLQSRLEDLALIPSLRDVDVVVAGGGDDLLANSDDLLIPGDVPVAAYPIFAGDAAGRQIPVVTTSGGYGYVGRLIIGFDRKGDVALISDRSGPVRVAGGTQPDAVVPDPTVQSLVVNPVAAYVANLAANVVASSQVPLDGTRTNVRTIETNLGNLVADALLWEARQRASSFGAPQPVIALQNGGGIRNASLLPAGPLSEKNTFDILPFANFVTIVPNVTRAQLKEILENAVSRVAFVDGRFAQVAGFRFTWDAARTAQVLDASLNVLTPGDRVRDVTLDDGTVIVQGGAVVAGADIPVATIDFLAVQNGDQYPFRGVPFVRVGATYQQALSNFLQQGLGGTVTATAYPAGGVGRITRLN